MKTHSRSYSHSTFSLTAWWKIVEFYEVHMRWCDIEIKWLCGRVLNEMKWNEKTIHGEFVCVKYIYWMSMKLAHKLLSLVMDYRYLDFDRIQNKTPNWSSSSSKNNKTAYIEQTSQWASDTPSTSTKASAGQWPLKHNAHVQRIRSVYCMYACMHAYHACVLKEIAKILNSKWDELLISIFTRSLLNISLQSFFSWPSNWSTQFLMKCLRKL